MDAGGRPGECGRPLARFPPPAAAVSLLPASSISLSPFLHHPRLLLSLSHARSVHSALAASPTGGPLHQAPGPGRPHQPDDCSCPLGLPCLVFHRADHVNSERRRFPAQSARARRVSPLPQSRPCSASRPLALPAHPVTSRPLATLLVAHSSLQEWSVQQRRGRPSACPAS